MASISGMHDSLGGVSAILICGRAQDGWTLASMMAVWKKQKGVAADRLTLYWQQAEVSGCHQGAHETSVKKSCKVS